MPGTCCNEDEECCRSFSTYFTAFMTTMGRPFKNAEVALNCLVGPDGDGDAQTSCSGVASGGSTVKSQLMRLFASTVEHHGKEPTAGAISMEREMVWWKGYGRPESWPWELQLVVGLSGLDATIRIATPAEAELDADPPERVFATLRIDPRRLRSNFTIATQGRGRGQGSLVVEDYWGRHVTTAEKAEHLGSLGSRPFILFYAC